jgi:hypothetical protein
MNIFLALPWEQIIPAVVTLVIGWLGSKIDTKRTSQAYQLFRGVVNDTLEYTSTAESLEEFLRRVATNAAAAGMKKLTKAWVDHATEAFKAKQKRLASARDTK